MNRNRLLLIGLAAILVAALLTVLAYRSSLAKVAAIERHTAKVVVAAKPLVIGKMIQPDDVKVVDLPDGNLPAGFFSDPAKVVGRGIIATTAVNEIVLPAKLAAEKAGAGLPAMIPAKMRAVSVKVNEVIAVAGFVIPGTRVDVLLTGSPENKPNTPDVMTTTVLENIEVLAAGQQIQPNAEGKPEKVTVITLLVSPDDAQKLTLASSEGKIQLALRNPVDADKANVIAVKNASLYKVPEFVKPAPAKEPAKRTPVARKTAAAAPPPPTVYVFEVIRGEKREATKF